MRMLASSLVGVALIGIGLVAVAPPAYGCRCVPISTEQAFERASAVFTGQQVDSDDRPPSNSVLTFEVRRVYKDEHGTVHELQAVATGATSCGLQDTTGRWVIFAQPRDMGTAAPMATNMCLGGGPAGQKALTTLAKLGTPAEPRAGSSAGTSDGLPPYVPLLAITAVVLAAAATVLAIVRRSRRKERS